VKSQQQAAQYEHPGKANDPVAPALPLSRALHHFAPVQQLGLGVAIHLGAVLGQIHDEYRVATITPPTVPALAGHHAPERLH